MNVKILTLIAGIFLTIASLSNLWYYLWDVVGLGIGATLVVIAIKELKIKT